MSKTLSRPARSSMPVQQASSAVWAGFALLGAVVVAFAVTTIPGVRSSPGFDVRFDGWLQCGGYVVAAAVAVARPATRSARRALWAWIAAALALRAVGFLVYVLFVRTDQGPPPAPSWADAAWLASAGALLVGLWQLSRVHAPRRSPTLVLDALMGGLTAAAVAVSVLYPALAKATAARHPGGRRRHQSRLSVDRRGPARPGRGAARRTAGAGLAGPCGAVDRHRWVRGRRLCLPLPGDRGDLPPRERAVRRCPWRPPR